MVNLPPAVPIQPIISPLAARQARGYYRSPRVEWKCDLLCQMFTLRAFTVVRPRRRFVAERQGRGFVAVDTAAGKADIARRGPVVTKSGLPAEDQNP